MTDLFLYLHYLLLMRIEDIFPDFSQKEEILVLLLSGLTAVENKFQYISPSI